MGDTVKLVCRHHVSCHVHRHLAHYRSLSLTLFSSQFSQLQQVRPVGTEPHRTYGSDFVTPDGRIDRPRGTRGKVQGVVCFADR